MLQDPAPRRPLSPGERWGGLGLSLLLLGLFVADMLAPFEPRKLALPLLLLFPLSQPTQMQKMVLLPALMPLPLLPTATAAALPPRATAVATKTLAATAKAGAQTTINNELKVAAATATITATMTVMTTTIKT
mgnify:CR=1 FL=1